jgi:hypothetical protein
MGAGGFMTDPVIVAQAPPPQQPPPILPFQGPLPFLPAFQPLAVGEADAGMVVFQSNGHICRVPRFINFNKMQTYFAKCPSDKFLAPDHPECSCGTYTSNFDDFGSVVIKSGSWSYYASGNGALYPVVMLAVLSVALIIICMPFVYFFSYRMSRRELSQSHREGFFFQWHKQRLSSLICLTMICFGFILLLLGVSGNSEIAVFGLFTISTSLPGIVFALLGFLTWRIILTRAPDEPAKRQRAKAGA